MSVFVIVATDERSASKEPHVQDEPTHPSTSNRRDSSARRMSLGLPSSPRKPSITSTRRKSLGLASRESSITQLDKVHTYQQLSTSRLSKS